MRTNKDNALCGALSFKVIGAYSVIRLILAVLGIFGAAGIAAVLGILAVLVIVHFDTSFIFDPLLSFPNTVSLMQKRKVLILQAGIVFSLKYVIMIFTE